MSVFHEYCKDSNTELLVKCSFVSKFIYDRNKIIARFSFRFFFYQKRGRGGWRFFYFFYRNLVNVICESDRGRVYVRVGEK